MKTTLSFVIIAIISGAGHAIKNLLKTAIATSKSGIGLLNVLEVALDLHLRLE